jgi:hypothetical protein
LHQWTQCKHSDASSSIKVWSPKQSDKINPIANYSSLREIEKLKLQIKSLEARDETRSESSISNISGIPSLAMVNKNQNGASKAEHHPSSQIQPKKHWEGIYSRCAQSQQTSYYGPSSSYYFINRIGIHLGRELEQPQPDHQLHPRSASTIYASPESPDAEPLNKSSIQSTSTSGQSFVSRAQEEYLLGVFWQFYYCTLPIIDEIDFRVYYNGLWMKNSTTTRSPSPLIDIILALCMQHGFALMPNSPSITNSKTDRDDSSIAGRWFYRRSRKLMEGYLESPSIATLQCHIYASIYLSCASFYNMAHNTLSIAVRTAQILGLHLDPPRYLPEKERELRRRIWWVLSTVETKTCMKLGRPFAYRISDVSCLIPSDTQEAVALTGSTLGDSGSDVTWLSYSVQSQKLILMARKIHEDVYNEYGSLLSLRKLEVPYEDAGTLENCAKYLRSKEHVFQLWLDSVPAGIQTKRRNGGVPFSTDRSSLDIEQHCPLWLQRQRICLELVYHTMAMNLYRPFITFTRDYEVNTPTAESHATVCINHAIAHTYVLHQVISETDLLNGWHEAFQWQWNATITILGYLLAYPMSPSTYTARRATDQAISTFELIGRNNVAVSRSAASVTRDLVAKVDSLVDRFKTGLGISSTSQSPGTSSDLTNDLPPTGSFSSIPVQYSNDSLDFMDMVLGVDYFNNFEDFFMDDINKS